MAKEEGSGPGPAAARDLSADSPEVRELIADVEESAAAYVRGDMERHLELIDYAPGFTLLPPYGGSAARFEEVADRVRESADFFQNGEAKLEDIELQVWGDTVVMALIERQHGEVGGLPDQDISLRVTQIFRRVGDAWLLVHRHADPLVRERPIEFVNEMARWGSEDPPRPD